jgi:hypothetical protein
MAMKKRFHQSVKDKRDDFRDVKATKKEYRDMQPSARYGDRLEWLGEDMYAGLDSRRSLERRDSGMINEDRNAIANLPQQVSYKLWPTARHYKDFGLDDTIRGIDHQQDLDNSRMEQHLQPEKY